MIDFKKKYKRYHEELKILLCFVFGFLFLNNDWNLKSSIFTFIFDLFNRFLQFIVFLFLNLIEYLLVLTFSDVVGIFLILIACILSFMRIRNNLISRNHLNREYPVCYSKLKRIHSSVYQNIIKVVFRLKTKNYLCPKCFFTDYKISKLKTK